MNEVRQHASEEKQRLLMDASKQVRSLQEANLQSHSKEVWTLPNSLYMYLSVCLSVCRTVGTVVVELLKLVVGATKLVTVVPTASTKIGTDT